MTTRDVAQHNRTYVPVLFTGAPDGYVTEFDPTQGFLTLIVHFKSDPLLGAAPSKGGNPLARTEAELDRLHEPASLMPLN